MTSFNGSLDEEEGGGGTREGDHHTARAAGSENWDSSPLPKPHTSSSSSAAATAARHPRESLDGDPIFAVGEDADKWSDDDDDDDGESQRGSAEGKRLTGKDK